MPTPVVTPLGVTRSLTGHETLTIASVLLAAGDSLFVWCSSDSPDTAADAVFWGSIPLYKVDETTDGVLNSIQLWALMQAGYGTASITSTWGINGGDKCVMAAQQVTHATSSPSTLSSIGIDDHPVLDAELAGTGIGVFLGGVSTAGPNGDAAGSWDNSFVADDRFGTTGGGSNNTLSTGHLVVADDAAYAIGKSGITSREWAMIGAFINAVDEPPPPPPDEQTTTYFPGERNSSVPIAVDALTVIPAPSLPPPPPVYNPLPPPIGTPGGVYVPAPVYQPLPAPSPGSVNVVVPPIDGFFGLQLPFSPTLNQASAYAMVTPDQAYFAASADLTPGGIQFGNPTSDKPVSMRLIVAIDRLPTQLSDPEEPHILFDFFDRTSGKARSWIGVTPSGQVCAGIGYLPAVTLKSPISTIRADSSYHFIGLEWYVGKVKLLFDDIVIATLEPGPGPFGVDTPATLVPPLQRFMLFNGKEGATRCACAIAFASWSNAYDGMEWRVNEAAGPTLHSTSTYLATGALGTSAVVTASLVVDDSTWQSDTAGAFGTVVVGSPVRDFPLEQGSKVTAQISASRVTILPALQGGGSQHRPLIIGPLTADLVAQFYDPATVGQPHLWGPVPTGTPVFTWRHATPYLQRNPINPIYTPVAGPS